MKLLSQFRYALCNGQVKEINNVTKECRKSEKYTCLGCGNEMVAVLGQVREHHFRHKNSENCSNETYLHNLAKKMIKEIFDTQEYFVIQHNANNVCEQLDSCPFKRCKKNVQRKIDLKKYFDTCEIEKTCGGFRPDVLLTHSEHSDRKLFIEVNVNHPCTYEKINSGIRIIEIDVDSELTTIHPFDEQNRHMHFFNFKFERKIRPTTKVERFSLLSDDKGKHLKLDEIDCCQFDEHLPNAVYDIISQEPNDNNSLISGLAHALNHGEDIRHCYFCLIRHCNRPDKGWIAAASCPYYIRDKRKCIAIERKYADCDFVFWKKGE
ncbi:MAG: hypothetical protein KBT10_04955 [Bacteroidales bacterium]|nr:hypothetical protein [Candidatus Sodaliphilus aphodohippi]